MQQKADTESYITMGQMAKLCCVSEKALRIYHRMGILIPAYIKEDSGYRYYTLQQCGTVDMIVILRSIGCTLEEVKELMDTHNQDYLMQVLDGHLSSIKDRIAELELSRSNAEYLLENCYMLKNKPLLEQFQFEYLPKREILSMPVSHAITPTGSNWEYDRSLFKKRLLEAGLPLFLCRNMGAIVSEESLRNETPIIDRIYVYMRGFNGASVAEREVLPAGMHLVLYLEYHEELDEQFPDEEVFASSMLDYARMNGYELNGDFFDETLADTPLFGYAGRGAFCRFCLPVLRADRRNSTSQKQP